MWCFLLPFALVLYVFFDVNYFLRTVFTVAYGKIFEKKRKVTDPTTIHGFCFTQDMDLAFGHMNNARFLRDLDFARFHFYDRTGIYGEMKKRKTTVLQAASNIRYRRIIPLFTFYKIVTQLVYWDEKSIYLEQKFITRDGFIRAVVLSKQAETKAMVEEIMVTLKAPDKPKITPDLDLWIKSIKASSEKLRPTIDSSE